MFNNLELVDVIRHYDLRVATIESYPTYHILKTNRGTKVLRAWNDIETLNEAFQFRESLVSSGFRKIDRFIRTKDGASYVNHKGLGYSLSDWIEGSIPSLDKKTDIQTLGMIVGELHSALSKIEVKDSFEPWSKHFHRGREHLENTKNHITKKVSKTRLDEQILTGIDNHLKQVNESIKMAKKVEKNAFGKGLGPKWCHGNLHVNKFRIDEYGDGWIAELGIPIVEIPAYDISKLITNVYQLSGYKEEAVYLLLDNYQQFVPFKKEDKYWILTYLSYPHDIWKLLYVYYVAKVPNTSNKPEKQYQQLVEQQQNLSQLYKGLYSYFEL